MKRTLILTVVFIFIASIASVSVVSAQCGPRGPKAGGPGCRGQDDFLGSCNLMKCGKELNLTDDQMGKVKEINFAHKYATIDLKAALEKAQLRVRHEMNADQPNKASALAATKELHAIKLQMAEARINLMFDLRSVLNAEQLEKWKKCQKECGGKCGPGGMPGFHGDMDQPEAPMMGGGHGDKKRDGSCMMKP